MMIDPERRRIAQEYIQEFNRRVREKLCTRCERPVESYEQVGRCVYGDPCGHRQWQGRIP